MIKITDASKIFSVGGENIRALDSVSVSVAKGGFTAILGVSGSGKSTLMNIMGCLDRGFSGGYTLDGTDTSGLSEKQLSRLRSEKISFVFQSFNLVPTLTALENIELPLIYRGISGEERMRLALEALSAVGLSDRAGHRPQQLSGGQQQRIAIARAFAADAPLILADEPCGNLDSCSGGAVMEMLCEMHRHGKTVVLITHDESAAKAASDIIRLRNGRIDEE